MSPLSTSPPWKGSGKRLESMVRKALYEFHMLENSTGIGVALSGGKDSLALLLLLKAILGQGAPTLPLVALHVDGELSCGAGLQTPLLHSLCTQLSIPLKIKTQKPRPSVECYSCSRDRRTLLFEMAREANLSTVAFGHHRDDQVQTLLMNLLHKAEFAGMLPKLPMHHYDVTLIRPLIYASEAEIRSFAKEQGFLRTTCQCPVGQNSLRKKTEMLLSSLEALYPNARANLAQAGLLYGSQKAAADRFVDKKDSNT